jgi:hypothetical protein
VEIDRVSLAVVKKMWKEGGCLLGFCIATIALVNEAATTSETSVKTSTRQHGATTQKTAIFILATLRTANLKCERILSVVIHCYHKHTPI